MPEYKDEVATLIKTYAKYKELLQTESELSTKRAKQKIYGTVDQALVQEYEDTRQAIQNLSDSMTFSNPFVWIMYKFEAYKDEAQPIRTMRDFRIHCSKNGDICAQRFAFMNEQLSTYGHRPLTDSDVYEDDDSLDTIVHRKDVQQVVAKSDFMKLWESHEYYQIAGKSAKWQNYLQGV